jgi:hypothetical protein
MRILHAFQETKGSDRKRHVKAYFGVAPGGEEDEHEDGSYVICYCGARLVPLEYGENDNITVAGVWHNYKKIREEDE